MLFPSFKAWNAAIRLAVPAYLGVIIFPLSSWISILLAVVYAIETKSLNRDIFLLFLVPAIILLILGFSFYLLIKLVFRFIVWIVWSNPFQWLLPNKDISINLHKFTILTIATLPISILLIVAIAAETGIEAISTVEIIKHKDFIPSLLMRFFWLWLTIAAYLLHWFPVRQKSPLKRNAQPIS